MYRLGGTANPCSRWKFSVYDVSSPNLDFDPCVKVAMWRFTKIADKPCIHGFIVLHRNMSQSRLGPILPNFVLSPSNCKVQDLVKELLLIPSDYPPFEYGTYYNRSLLSYDFSKVQKALDDITNESRLPHVPRKSDSVQPVNDTPVTGQLLTPFSNPNNLPRESDSVQAVNHTPVTGQFLTSFSNINNVPVDNVASDTGSVNSPVVDVSNQCNNMRTYASVVKTDPRRFNKRHYAHSRNYSRNA